ncbi:MAG: hypothetical protein ABIS27_13440 [Longimicrobiales bacterium]
MTVPRVVMVVTADAELGTYIEQCLRRIPDVTVLDPTADTALDAPAGAAPDLLVCDAFHSVTAAPGAAARLLVLDEAPAADDPALATGARVGWILAPFDADSLSRAALRLLPSA